MADGDGRDQNNVAADHDVFTDGGFVLVKTVVIGGDGAAGIIRARADFGVADIGQVVGLDPFMEEGVFDLDEIADFDFWPEMRSRTQPRKRANGAAGIDLCPFDMAERKDRHIVGDHDAGTENDIRADFDIAADYRVP